MEQLWLHILRTCAWVCQVRQSAVLTISGWLQRFGVTESLSLNTNSVVEAEIQHSYLKATATSVIHPAVPSPLAIHSQHFCPSTVATDTRPQPSCAVNRSTPCWKHMIKFRNVAQRDRSNRCDWKRWQIAGLNMAFLTPSSMWDSFLHLDIIHITIKFKSCRHIDIWFARLWIIHAVRHSLKDLTPLTSKTKKSKKKKHYPSTSQMSSLRHTSGEYFCGQRDLPIHWITGGSAGTPAGDGPSKPYILSTFTRDSSSDWLVEEIIWNYLIQKQRLLPNHRIFL